MEVTFEISDDLYYIATQIVAMSQGKISSMSLKDIQTAQSELSRIERTCEEVEPVLA